MQSFYYGADLSYVNEMEDCGVQYQENGTAKEAYQIFSDYGHNLVRLRLWHTPSFYDTLNMGNRYSDLQDVKKSIQRAKNAGMNVLLDFHLSDFWADPSRQLVPVAWEGVVNNLPLLQDSLYSYVHSTLLELNSENLLPEMVQIGNETNKGILLSPAVNAQGWVLDWPRNAALFNTAIQAVRDVQNAVQKDILVAIHIANPKDTEWFIETFIDYGVTDFEVIGMSYYWAWHKPVSIAQTGQIVKNLTSYYPNKQILIFETGYPWTTAWNDNASNIITELHPNYSPASPSNQKQWMLDLAASVKQNGGHGVIYWEPAWQSSPCSTPWGQGSHQEHATYFDFDNNTLPDGGMSWPQTFVSASFTPNFEKSNPNNTTVVLHDRSLDIEATALWKDSTNLSVKLFDLSGKLTLSQYYGKQKNNNLTVHFPIDIPNGHYILNVYDGEKLMLVRRVQM